MQITENFDITKHNNNTFHWSINGAIHFSSSSDAEFSELCVLYDNMKSCSPDKRATLLEIYQKAGKFPKVLGATASPDTTDATTAIPAPVATPEEVLKNGIEKLMDFFSEFQFTPSFRFTNTLATKFCLSKSNGASYITNYFRLMDSSYTQEVVEKMKSKEFTAIAEAIKQYGKPKSNINSRLKIYFGSAGTGKTTIAQTESDSRCIVCNNSMLPSDLMEDFRFSDGKAEFTPSILCDCMENGKAIVLDEINLLPFDSLRFLQGICDGKKEFSYKNRPIHIADGFQIIGTMNLTLGGMNYGLPEPLVDRCSDIKEFTLTADQLMKAITE